jgi:membrane protein implicated in regulation of membrane protease activity
MHMLVMIILMFLPLLAIPVFFYLPADESVPIYLAGVLISAFMFWLMRRTGRIPVATGARGLINQDAIVVSKTAGRFRETYTVQVEGELWNARSDDNIQAGETATIVEAKGNLLAIRKKEKQPTTFSGGDREAR